MKVLVVSVVLTLMGLLWWLNISSGNADSIKSGELQYSEELGWINWGHAKPDGPKTAFESLLRLNSENADSFEFSYCQYMKAKLAGQWREAEYCEAVKMPAGLSKTEAQRAFFHIFIEVSVGFETLQGSLPYSASADSRNSSFREGDLMGNLIGFHCATEGIDLNAVKSKLTLYSIEESLKMYEEDGLKKEEFTADLITQRQEIIGKLIIISKE